jgi:hypothetical protein
MARVTDQAGRTDAGLRDATGKGRDEWYALLDAWGAVGRPYREIAGWLVERGMSDWWAQKTIVEYEQARGVRGAGARRDGTFSAGASKTIAAPADRVFAAFVDASIRTRWLPDVELEQRSAQVGTRIRFDLPADGTRLTVELADKRDGRTLVGVEQDRLRTPEAAAAMRGYWKDRLEGLKATVEG